MPAPSKVTQLPEEVRRWLDQSLVEGDFSGYNALAEELETRGYEISKSALGRYGKEFKQRLERIKMRTQMAVALRDFVGDDDGTMVDALNRIMMDKLWAVLEAMDGADVDPKQIAQLSRAVSDLSRATVSQKKFMDEMRTKAAAAAEEVSDLAKAEGLSSDGIATLRRKILNIPGA